MTSGVNVLFGRKAGKIGELQLDVTLEENHLYENDVSMFPVEDGFDITDNVKQRPDSFTITGFVTNSPIAILYEDVSEVLNEESGSVETRSTSRVGANTNVELAFDVLLKISGRQVQGLNTPPEAVDIVTGLRVYNDMMMTSLEIPRTAKTGQILRFTAKFIKIRKVSSETITIPNPQTVFKDKTQSTVDKGKQTPTTASTEESTAASIAKNAYDAVSSFAGL